VYHTRQELCCHLWNAALSLYENVLPVLQVLEKLPEGLAIAVLAAPSAGLEHKLSVLPSSLHPLAVEAASFSIHYHRSLTLDFNAPVEKDTSYKLLHAATTATSTLREIDLRHIPVQNSKRLLELIPVACKSASDVRLDYGYQGEKPVPDLRHVVQLSAALSNNAALTSFHFTLQGQPDHDFKLDCLIDALTSLQSLSMDVVQCSEPCCGLPDPQHMLGLTHLQLGHGLNLNNLPQILPHLTRLQTLHLCCEQLQQLPPLATLTALQTLKLWRCLQLQQLPPLATLPALRTLKLHKCFELQQLPPLATLTALQTLEVVDCMQLQELPPLATLTALQTLEVVDCMQLQEMPPLTTMTALLTLRVQFCRKLQQLPHLATLTALQTLRVQRCAKLQQLPPLATLTALQTLEVYDCVQLQELPPLATLTALQTLCVQCCDKLQQLPPLATLTALQELEVNCCVAFQHLAFQHLPPLNTLSLLQKLYLDFPTCEHLKKFSFFGTMTALQALMLGCCHELQQLPPLATLTVLQTLKLWNCLHLRKLPPLPTVTALQTLSLSDCHTLTQLPRLATLTALRTLSLWRCHQLQHLPPLATLTALQTLMLAHCKQLKKLPPVAALTALQTLILQACVQLKQLPPLATLTALQTLDLQDCVQLQQLPPLATLTALQTLDLRCCYSLQRGCLTLPSTQGCEERLHIRTTWAWHILRDAHNAAPTELGGLLGRGGEESRPFEAIAERLSRGPSIGDRWKSFINKPRCFSLSTLACCGIPLRAGPDSFNP
jgi:Leucine-rich repeat (LRR) protein